MSSLLNVRPGSKPRFFSQKMEQNAHRKKDAFHARESN
jgi:hypothetical protein